MLDLDAYLARIGLEGGPTDVAQLHRAHATSIPFENLDPRRGIPVSLELGDLELKLVRARRGGYCFEQNLLLKAALEALGHEVDMMLARVRLGAEPGVIRPRSHLLLRVRAHGISWHADVGFGAGTPLEPLPFGPGGPHEQSGWIYRIVEDVRELVLQVRQQGEWRELYGFVPEPVPFVDLQTSNWSTSTHPRSPFVSGLIVAITAGDGTRISLSDRGELELSEETATQRLVSPVAWEEIPSLLAARFALTGVVFDGEGRLLPGEHGARACATLT